MKTKFPGYAPSAFLLLGLAACGTAPSEEKTANNAAEISADPVNATAAAGPAAATDAASAPLVLDGAGLRIPGASPPGTLGFETPQAAAIEALTAAFGGPPTERGTNAECGGGGLEFAEWKDKITIWFEEGRLAGWDSEGDLKTAGGIGIGSSRADVAALPGFEVEESSLGVEFRAGALSGILASNAADARVIHLWSGITCAFR